MREKQENTGRHTRGQKHRSTGRHTRGKHKNTEAPDVKQIKGEVLIRTTKWGQLCPLSFSFQRAIRTESVRYKNCTM